MSMDEPTMEPREMDVPGVGRARVAMLHGCTVIITKEAGKWHLSISHKDRDPSYFDIKEARYRWIPDSATMAMIFPPAAEFVNMDPHCFHLFEI